MPKESESPTAPQSAAVQRDNSNSVDINKVLASYQRQIADQAGKIAVQEAVIETQREEIARLRGLVDELAASQTQPVAPAREKGKKK